MWHLSRIELTKMVNVCVCVCVCVCAYRCMMSISCPGKSETSSPPPPPPPATSFQAPVTQTRSHFFNTPRLHAPATHGAASPVAARLGHVAERFSSFYNDLEAEKQHRREAENQRRHTFSEHVTKLERSLESEIKRRADADAQLQAHLETEMKAAQDKIMLSVREHSLGLKASIDALGRSFAELHGALREEREQRAKDMEQLAVTLAAKVEEVAGSVDDERVARLEREAQTLKRVGEDILGCQERVEAVRKDLGQQTATMQAELSHLAGARSGAEEHFQAALMNEVNVLKSALQAEREERQSEDEQIVHAINDYTRALQDGLRIVNNT